MSGQEVSTLVDRIDADIQANRQRLLDDIRSYLVNNVYQLARQLDEKGVATIPTFAGDLTFTEQDVKRVVDEQQRSVAA